MVSEPRHLRAIVNQDGAAILDIESGKITTLNTAGGYVWQWLSQTENVSPQVESYRRSLARHMDRAARGITLAEAL